MVQRDLSYSGLFQSLCLRTVFRLIADRVFRVQLEHFHVASKKPGFGVRQCCQVGRHGPAFSFPPEGHLFYTVVAFGKRSRQVRSSPEQGLLLWEEFTACFQEVDDSWPILSQPFLCRKCHLYSHSTRAPPSWARAIRAVCHRPLSHPMFPWLLLPGKGGHSLQEAGRLNWLPFKFPVSSANKR